MESLRVRDVLTPRHVVAALPADMPVSEAFPALRDIPFSRIPIYEGEEAENITAFVLRADVMEAVAGDRFDTPLSELRRPLPVVHESMALARFFELLLGRRAHIAAVVDEYGALEGIATLEDALESLLGREIVDERDEVADMRAEARRRLRRLARRHSPG